MADSPKPDSLDRPNDSNISPGLGDQQSVGSSSNSTTATSPDLHPSPSFQGDGTDSSPNLTPESGGERLGDWFSNAGSSRNASVTASSPGSQVEEVRPASPQPGPSRTLAVSDDVAEATRSPSIANRRGKAPLPVRFAESNVMTKAGTIPASRASTRDASAAPRDPTNVNATMINILTKIELLPVVIALRSSARPGADPEDAHKAFEQAVKARNFAQQQGADTALLGQCSYYAAIANFAVGQSGQDMTIKLFEEAREAEGLNAEGDTADRWISYVREQQRLDRESDSSSMNSKDSFLGAFLNPIATMLGATRFSWSGSKASNAARRRAKPAGLYAQMAPARREVLTTKPAARQMPLWSDSSGSAPRRPNARLRGPQNRLHSYHSSQSGHPASFSVLRLDGLPPRPREKRDSQGNFLHLNTGLKYNEEHPFGLDVPFTTSPEKYKPSTPSTSLRKPEDEPPNDAPRRVRYFIVNPDPSDPSSSIASAGAAPSRKMTSSTGGGGGEEVDGNDGKIPQPKRKSSWISRKLNLAMTDRETGSPTKSLEAMVEEWESPLFKPEGFGDGKFGVGKKKTL